MNFKFNLSILLPLAGLNQKELADIVGVAESTISVINKNNRSGKHTLKRIARALSERINHIPWEVFENGRALL